MSMFIEPAIQMLLATSYLILSNLNWLTLRHVMLSKAKHLYGSNRDPSLALRVTYCKGIQVNLNKYLHPAFSLGYFYPAQNSHFSFSL